MLEKNLSHARSNPVNSHLINWGAPHRFTKVGSCVAINICLSLDSVSKNFKDSCFTRGFKPSSGSSIRTISSSLKRISTTKQANDLTPEPCSEIGVSKSSPSTDHQLLHLFIQRTKKDFHLNPYRVFGKKNSVRMASTLPANSPNARLFTISAIKSVEQG